MSLLREISKDKGRSFHWVAYGGIKGKSVPAFIDYAVIPFSLNNLFVIIASVFFFQIIMFYLKFGKEVENHWQVQLSEVG